jgi:GNAT superfamily N-acetyltransferase
MPYAVRSVLVDRPTTAQVAGVVNSRLITPGSRHVVTAQILLDPANVRQPGASSVAPKAGAIIADMIIRPIRNDDRQAWEPLWHGYFEFYRAALMPEVTDATWAALCDPTSPVHGLVAEQDDQLVGLAHLIVHATTWATHPTCYLEDLYVAKLWRGQDIARRLIEAAYAFADESGAGSVYWMTQEYNAPARSLYDTLAHRTSFVVYQR